MAAAAATRSASATGSATRSTAAPRRTSFRGLQGRAPRLRAASDAAPQRLALARAAWADMTVAVRSGARDCSARRGRGGRRRTRGAGRDEGCVVLAAARDDRAHEPDRAGAFAPTTTPGGNQLLSAPDGPSLRGRPATSCRRSSTPGRRRSGHLRESGAYYLTFGQPRRCARSGLGRAARRRRQPGDRRACRRSPAEVFVGRRGGSAAAQASRGSALRAWPTATCRSSRPPTATAPASDTGRSPLPRRPPRPARWSASSGWTSMRADPRRRSCSSSSRLPCASSQIARLRPRRHSVKRCS